jgi:hypothetical protein
MTEILRVTLVAILLTIGFACYFLVVSALFSNRVARTIKVVKQMPGRSLGIGFVNFVFFATITIALFAVAEEFQESGRTVPYAILMIPTLLLAAILVVFLTLGLSAMIDILGERIFPEKSGWQKTVWGTVILAFGSAIPTVGWFLLFPYVAIMGFGAVIFGFFQRDG